MDDPKRFRIAPPFAQSKAGRNYRVIDSETDLVLAYHRSRSRLEILIRMLNRADELIKANDE